jgi:hypothetical protein
VKPFANGKKKPILAFPKGRNTYSKIKESF